MGLLVLSMTNVGKWRRVRERAREREQNLGRKEGTGTNGNRKWGKGRKTKKRKKLGGSVCVVCKKDERTTVRLSSKIDKQTNNRREREG
jgi:hypothetical protein